MSGRFEIEDWVAQDSSRVVFRARDRETGARVALRRLLPRGHGGAGLSEDEAQAFDLSMRLLAEVRAPGLRRVAGWGIDPIDRLPYHASEWVDGETLEAVLGRGVLSAEAGRMLAEAALVAQVALDESGGGWQLATDPGAVIVVGGEQEFWFSFWVAAYPGPSAGSAVEGLAALIERAMGWRGRLPAGTSKGGLVAWLRLVRQGRCSALEALATLRGAGEPVAEEEVEMEATAPSKPPVRPPADLSWTLPRRSKRTGLWIGAASVALVLVGLAVWWAIRQRNRAADSADLGVAVVAKQQRAAQDRMAEVNARAAELARLAAAGDEPVLKDKYSPADGGLLRQMVGREVVLEGKLMTVRDSSSGKTRYLEFSTLRGLDDVCGRYWAQEGGGLTLGELKPLEGRRVKMTGKVQIETGTGRVVVHLERRDQLQDLGPGALRG